jgi:hypothetical protein
MIAIIKGDIINSRNISNPESWLVPLKQLFSQWGNNPEQWELVWGDFFQLEVADPAKVLTKALTIKALIKKIPPFNKNQKISPIDVRMSIGIGEKTYTGTRISESNGEAFIFAGEEFEKLKKAKTNLLIQTAYPDFDEEMNLYLKLISTFIDKWSNSSAELALEVLQNPNISQSEIGKLFGIRQNSVSGRWNRAKIDEILEVIKIFQKKSEKLF